MWLNTFINFINIILVTVLFCYIIFWSYVFITYPDKFNNVIDATIINVICNRVCDISCNKNNLGSSKSCGVFCNVEMIRDDVSVYMCEMTIKYIIDNTTYTRNISVVGHNLYFKNQIISIQYDINNPLDIRIAQPTYYEIGNIIFEISIGTLIILWLVYSFTLILNNKSSVINQV